MPLSRSFSPRFFAIMMICLTAGVRQPAHAETVTFEFASFGMSYQAAMFADDPLAGLAVTGARIFLEIESFPGSDAAGFFTDIALPIEPSNPDGSSALFLSGAELGWSGAGNFNYFAETDQFNGIFIPRRYGAETYGEGFEGELIVGKIELDVPDYIRGDFDRDLTLDVDDLDLLTDDVRFEFHSRAFDLDQDGEVTQEDRRIWVEDLRRTYFGDANLDGQFDSTDLVEVFIAGQYEQKSDEPARWATGDWNGDGKFDSSDFVLALAAGGYDQGPRAAVQAVPEPAASALLLTGLLAYGVKRRGVVGRSRSLA